MAYHKCSACLQTKICTTYNFAPGEPKVYLCEKCDAVIDAHKLIRQMGGIHGNLKVLTDCTANFIHTNGTNCQFCRRERTVIKSNLETYRIYNTDQELVSTLEYGKHTVVPIKTGDLVVCTNYGTDLDYTPLLINDSKHGIMELRWGTKPGDDSYIVNKNNSDNFYDVVSATVDGTILRAKFVRDAYLSKRVLCEEPRYADKLWLTMCDECWAPFKLELTPGMGNAAYTNAVNRWLDSIENRRCPKCHQLDVGKIVKNVRMFRIGSLPTYDKNLRYVKHDLVTIPANGLLIGHDMGDAIFGASTNNSGYIWFRKDPSLQWVPVKTYDLLDEYAYFWKEDKPTIRRVRWYYIMKDQEFFAIKQERSYPDSMFNVTMCPDCWKKFHVDCMKLDTDEEYTAYIDQLLEELGR